MSEPFKCPRCVDVIDPDCPACKGKGVVWSPGKAEEQADRKPAGALDLTYEP